MNAEVLGRVSSVHPIIGELGHGCRTLDQPISNEIRKPDEDTIDHSRIEALGRL